MKKIIVIGGGISGLFTALILSKYGYKLTVLEANRQIGGGLHTFKRGDKEFETGIHIIGGFQEGQPMYKLCSYLGIMDKLNIKESSGEYSDTFHIGEDNKQYHLGSGRETFTKSLINYFPNSKDEILNYIQALYGICDNVPLFSLKYSAINYMSEDMLIPINKFIESYITDKKLQNVLAWNNPLYAGVKNETPIYIHALVSKMFIEGSSKFINGSQQLADALVESIQKLGGEVFTNTKVNKLSVEDKLVTSLTTEKGKEYSADYFISSISPKILIELLPKDKLKGMFWKRISKMKDTYSAFSIFIELKPKTFKYINNAYYYQDSYEDTWNHGTYIIDKWPKGYLLVTPPVENQEEYADKIIINAVMNYSDVEKWDESRTGKRGEKYEQFKSESCDKLLDKVEIAFPKIRKCIERIYTSTPLTIKDYLNNNRGALYGVQKDGNHMEDSYLTPKTKYKNLFLTGQNINLHGILGAPITSLITCSEFIDLEELLFNINK